MKHVFIDTNVLLDALNDSRPMHTEGKRILLLASRGIIKGTVSTQSIVNVAFIYTKGHKERMNELKALIRQYDSIFTIVDTTRHCLMMATTHYYDDFEDAVQTSLAIDNYCDLIISRDANFDGSFGPPVVSPDEFCREYFEE